LVDDACEKLAADAAAVWLRGRDGSELALSGAAGFAHPATTATLAHRPAARLSDWLPARRLPAAVTLAPNDADGERAWLAAEDIHSLIAVRLPGAETLGILAAFRRRRPFPVGHLARAVGIATATAPAVHAAQRLEEERRRAERAEALLDIAHLLADSDDFDVALEESGRRTARALGARRSHVSLSTGKTRPPAGALVVPLCGRDGVVGSLTLDGSPAAGWTPAAVELAVAVGAEMGRAAERARRSPATGAATVPPELIQREALRALAGLASGAAHHLNNLLTIVVGRVQLVLRSTEDERVRRPLTIVEKAAKDGADVVRRLQEFARARPVRQPRPVRVNRLLAEVLALVHARSPRTPVTKVDVDMRLADVPPISGDAAALREALTHIVDNALEAMPNGGRLLVETHATADTVSVAVTDSGVGMSDAVRVHAPEPFFTTKGEKATGLGLSVAHGVARSHGGELAIESAEGAGTTVIVTLPRVETER
jgi:signal transduction histidine kinase